jgi:hypothetical protein
MAKERRKSKLRDLLVTRVLKSINNQNLLKRRRINELSKGSMSNREKEREDSRQREVSKKHFSNPLFIDKEFEDIAKIEVEAFLNQGKLLTDKNLKHVEKMIKERWRRTKGVNYGQKFNYYESKSNNNLPDALSHSGLKVRKVGVSSSPHVNNLWRGVNENVYDIKGREGNRWGSILGNKKDEIVNQLNDRLNNSSNPNPKKFQKSINRYNYALEGEDYTNVKNLNASSCEKLPQNRIDVSYQKINGSAVALNLKDSLNTRNKVSSSIAVDK